MRVLANWCIPLIALLAFLLIQFWLQLLKWKNWGKAYRDWVKAHCSCPSPGGNGDPKEPDWP